MTARRFFTHPLGILISAIAATFLWGSALPLIKVSYIELAIGAEEVGKQILFAGYRFTGAGMLILIFALLIGKPLAYVPGTWHRIGRVALFQTFLQYVVLYIAMSVSSGIQGSIISGTTSFFQIAIAHFMYKNDRFTIRKAVGLSLGFLGVIMVNMGQGEVSFDFGLGAWLMLLAMLFGALGNVLAKSEAERMELLYMTGYQMMLGGLGLLLIGIMQAGWMPFAFSLKAALILVFLMFVSAAGFILWNSVMKYNEVGKVSMYLSLTPVFGVMISTLTLGERISFMALLSLAFVATGIIVVNRNGSRSPRPEDLTA